MATAVSAVEPVLLEQSQVTVAEVKSAIVEKPTTGKPQQRRHHNIPAPSVPRKNVTAFVVLNKMVNELSGKNCLAKVVQYLMRLLVFYSSRYQKSFITANKSMLVQITTLSEKQGVSSNNLIKLLLRNPIFLAGYFKFVFLRKFIDRCDGVANGLSLFRQTLRFGKTPFRVVNLTNNIVYQLLHKKNYGYFATDNFATDLVDTSYGIVDELGLLFKFKFFNSERHPTAKRIIGKSDEIIWLADIFYQLKIGYAKLQALKYQKEKIIREGLEDEKLSAEEYSAQIAKLEHEIKITNYGLCKSTCDLLFDLIDLFSLNATKYVYYGLGLGSGVFNTLKTYASAKKLLEDNA